MGEEEGTVKIVRGFLHVEIEGLPRELKAEMDRAVEISEKRTKPMINRGTLCLAPSFFSAGVADALFEKTTRINKRGVSIKIRPILTIVAVCPVMSLMENPPAVTCPTA